MRLSNEEIAKWKKQDRRMGIWLALMFWALAVGCAVAAGSYNGLWLVALGLFLVGCWVARRAYR